MKKTHVRRQVYRMASRQAKSSSMSIPYMHCKVKMDRRRSRNKACLRKKYDPQYFRAAN